MTLKSTAAAALPIMLGVFGAGLVLYYFGQQVSILKDVQLGFTNGNASASNTGTQPTLLQSLTGGLL